MGGTGGLNMGDVENICVVLIVIILLGTIGMTIYFHMSGRKKWTTHLLVGSLAIMFTMSLPLLLNLRSEQEAEIEKVIASRKGRILRQPPRAVVLRGGRPLSHFADGPVYR